LKKIILFLILISSLYANQSDAKIYLGTSYGYLNETFSESEYDSISLQTAKVKIGYGIRDSYAVEFSIDYTQKDKDVFSSKDGDRYGLNLELMKAFDFDIYINPFFKGGFGAGYLDIDNSSNSSLSYSSYNLAVGCFIPVNEHLDFELGYSYKFTSYEKIQEGVKELNSHVNIGYLGVNVRF
jgi:hypothetical protein